MAAVLSNYPFPPPTTGLQQSVVDRRLAMVRNSLCNNSNNTTPSTQAPAPQPTTAANGRRVPFPLPKKLGSDRLLLVSKALHETPTYKSISPALQKQRQALRKQERSSSSRLLEARSEHRVRFRSVDTIHEYEKDYDLDDYPNLYFNDDEFAVIFERDDDDFSRCFRDMHHTKCMLQLWGMCSRATTATDEQDGRITRGVEALFFPPPDDAEQPPVTNPRGLESRIIVGIRNHRQKAVRSFLQHHRDQMDDHSCGRCLDASSGRLDASQATATGGDAVICPRYLKFSQTAGRFARALAEGDARVAQEIRDHEGEEEDSNDDDSDDDDEDGYDSDEDDYQ